MNEGLDVGHPSGLVDGQEVGQRHGERGLRPIAKVEVTHLLGAAFNEFSVYKTERLRHHILTRAGR
ncbi:hypothetical protein D3C77_764630 [compost metagenome]